jgi:hypothetical protein
MPKLISLAAYAVKVWDREDSECETLSNFGEGKDLFDYCHTFLAALQKKTANDKEFQHVIRIKKLKLESRRMYGIIETGDYGQESVLLDVDTEKVAYERLTNHANLLPFYFLFDLPVGSNTGIILLQRMGMFGIRKMLYRAMTEEFDKQFPDSRLQFHTLVDEEEIKKFQRGKIESIRFISFNIPSDVTDCFDSGHTEKIGRAELVIRARRGGFLPLSGRLRKFFAGGQSVPKLIALDETNFKYQDIKVKSRVGRSSRTMDLGNPNRLRSYYDITDTVEVDKTGHPRFTSIHELAEAMASRLRANLGLSNE